MPNKLEWQYQRILSDYLREQSEQNLYIGQNFVKQLIVKNVMPEEVTNMHKKAVESLFPDLPTSIKDAHDFLTEVMVHYGLAIREHQLLIQQQEERQVEMDVAAKIQKMILQTTIPESSEFDIGMLSIPFRDVSGDYVHFLYDDNKYVSMAVTDVVGKGVPAALCMSMVKYSLETLEYAEHDPSYVLEVINRIIEKSIDDSMFVSMFYGRYDIQENVFTYSSAGHEPAFFYDARRQQFKDLEAPGLLLGVLPEVQYPHYTVPLHTNDFIVMVTDGVTEFRTHLHVDARETMIAVLDGVKHLAAQEICEHVYKKLEKLQDYNIGDDFTIVVLKKI